MSSSKNEFLLGCVIGGILGVTTALLLPKKYLNGFVQKESAKKHILRTKALVKHADHSQSHVHSERKKTTNRVVKHK